MALVQRHIELIGMRAFKHFIYSYIIPFIGKLFMSRNKYVNVIYYHDVVDGEGKTFMRIGFETFKKQMEYLVSQGYTTCRFDDLQSENEHCFSKKRVLIAFDDGWKSNYSKIYELMKKLGLKYNVFLTIGEIGNNRDYLDWEMIRKMHQEGLVGFGVHTYSHPDMSDISRIDPEVEFTTADSIFRKELGYDPKDFCYPFGKYSEESNDYISKNQDYSRIYTSKMMYSYLQNGKIIFGRTAISDDDSCRIFRLKLNGYYNIWRSLLG